MGYAALGDWGLGVAVLLLGTLLTFVYTAIYDGPVALGRLVRRHRGAPPVSGLVGEGR